MKLNHPLALVLSGGNALAAYQAGVFEALDAAGLRPDWIAGASAGAINGALIAGNPPAERVARLRAFWRPGEAGPAAGPVDDWRRTMAVSATLLAGRADAFTPRNLFFPALPFGDPEPPSLFDTIPLQDALTRLVDYQRLNAGTPRFSVGAVDVETGDDVIFDTAEGPIGPDQLRASAAMMPVFPPVDVEGRLLADAGISANLPLDAVLGALTDERLLLVAVDLLPPEGRRPTTLSEVAERQQDLVFAAQSRRAITAWGRLFAERAAAGRPAPAVTLLHLIYADQEREVVGKAFDFSAATIAERWGKGVRDAGKMIRMLEDGRIVVGDKPGLHVHRLAAARAMAAT